MGRFSSIELNKMARVAELIGTPPNCLANVIGLESGFRPDIVNPNGGATGLIQFMPATAKQLGTTTNALRRMSAMRQLDFVLKFYAPHRGKLSTCRDLYVATFMPAFIGEPMATVLGKKDSDELLLPGKSSLTLGQVYAANAGLAVTKDGEITILDLDLMMLNRDTAARERANENPKLVRKADTSDPELMKQPRTVEATGALIPIALTLGALLLAAFFRKRG